MQIKGIWCIMVTATSITRSTRNIALPNKKGSLRPPNLLKCASACRWIKLRKWTPWRMQKSSNTRISKLPKRHRMRAWEEPNCLRWWTKIWSSVKHWKTNVHSSELNIWRRCKTFRLHSTRRSSKTNWMPSGRIFVVRNSTMWQVQTTGWRLRLSKQRKTTRRINFSKRKSGSTRLWRYNEMRISLLSKRKRSRSMISVKITSSKRLTVKSKVLYPSKIYECKNKTVFIYTS